MSDLPLPVPGQDPLACRTVELRERGDAARNRALLLDTAARLVAEKGAEALTMDCLAEQAGTGKGTIFRRFGSRSGLMLALLDRSEKEFQRAVMGGPPPLGPGAEPLQRLLAFGAAAVDRVEAVGELQQSADRSTRQPFDVPARLFVRQHLSMLLRQADLRPEADVELLALTLLAALEPGLLMYQLHTASIPAQRIRTNWDFLIRSLLP